jgi:hypothetical protein
MGLITHSKPRRGTALAEQAGALIKEAGERVGPVVEQTGARAGDLIREAGERLAPAVEQAGVRADELIGQARQAARESDLPSRVSERAAQLSASVPGTAAHGKAEKKARRRKRFRRMLLLGALGGGAAYVAKKLRPGAYDATPTVSTPPTDPPVAQDRVSDPLTDPLDEGAPPVT